MTRLRRVLNRPRNSWNEPPFWAHLDRSILISTTGEKEQVENNFQGYVQQAYKADGVVFACILARLLVFSEARFQWRRFERGRPTELFGSDDLRVLERPWPNGTTGELLARMEQDASLAGNFYATVVGEGTNRRIRRLRPDWVTVVTGSPSDDPFDINAEVVGYIYEPKAGPRRAQPVVLARDQVCHYSPIPDPEAQWRGMSWLTPVIEEIKGDKAATRHKLKFFENGAVPGLVVTYDKAVSLDAFKAFVEQFKVTHEGLEKAYKTLHLGGGADAKTVGADLRQLEFKATQGAGETRIAAAAGVHPVIVGLSEGLAGSSLNAGNFNSARRRFADGTIRPLWRIAASALESLVTPPEGAHLWYDARDIPFLREDAKEEAETRQRDAVTIRQLVEAGFEPASVVRAVTSGDFKQLEHTGKLSVQLQDVDAEVA